MRTQTATVKSREMNGQLLHQMGGDADGARIPIAGGNAIDNTFFTPQILYKAGACGNALAGALIVSQSRRGALGDGDNILNANGGVAEDHRGVWARRGHGGRKSVVEGKGGEAAERKDRGER